MAVARHAADLRPVFDAHIVVDFDGNLALRIEAVVSILARTRDPIMSAGFHVEVVPLVAALVLQERLPAIRDRAPRLREGHTADPRRAVERLLFALDIHDAGLVQAHPAASFGGWMTQVALKSGLSTTSPVPRNRYDAEVAATIPRRSGGRRKASPARPPARRSSMPRRASTETTSPCICSSRSPAGSTQVSPTRNVLPISPCANSSSQTRSSDITSA